MDLVKKIRELYLENYSKGTWETYNGDEFYVEDLKDSHLCNIPKFILNNYLKKLDYNYNRYKDGKTSEEFLNNERKLMLFKYYGIPDFITKEIEERGFFIDIKDHFRVKKKSPQKQIKK
jgi:hypothetical protein